MKANRVADFDAAKEPGDYFLSEPNADGEIRLSFLCPCGCGALAGIKVREDRQTTNFAWAWNGNIDKPTATPSIDIKPSHWHGYLTNGEFVKC